MSRREFQFREGSSNKFWAITVDGSEFTVEFGRIGTTGQTQTKKFASDAAAQQAADKLIAEKTKKGYSEVGGATASTIPAPSAKAKTRPKAEAAEPAASASNLSAAVPTITRRIDLVPRDWLWATWRPRDRYVTPPSQPQPFDKDACLEQFRSRVKVRVEDGGWWDWGKIKLHQPLSAEEAHFWAVAVTRTQPKQNPEILGKQLARQDFDGQVTSADIDAWVRTMKQQWPEQFVILWQAIPALLSPESFLELILDHDILASHWDAASLALTSFTDFIWPYLTGEQIERLRSRVRGRLDLAAWDDSNQSPQSLFFLLGALLGMHEEMLALVKSWPDGRYSNLLGSYFVYNWVQPQRIVFGLSDARQVDDHMRRLQLRLGTPLHVRAWLAITEFSGLDLVRDSILQLNREYAVQLLATFSLVKAPEVAPHMLELKLHSKAPALARQWLDDNPGNAIAGLIPVAAGRGKLAEAALDYLRAAQQQGHGAFLVEQLQSTTPEIANRVRQEVLERVEVVHEPLDGAATPKWLQTALKSTGKGGALPTWANVANLPPLVVGERRLNDNQMTAVLSALRGSPLTAPTPLLQAVKQHIDAVVRDAFVWKLFEMWMGEGAPSKEKWALLAIGHLGGDGAALKLTPLLRAWPGENQHQRAVAGLECLRAIGSDTALMQLNGIAQKLKFQGLKNKAQEFMEAIATDRGMSRTQLEDRIVPDLDLDERGTRVFDFGSRQFTVVLDADLKPMVRDDSGKLKSDLPKPGAKDEADKANAALADWKILKKQLREAIKVQAYRLEQAMVTGRRWNIQEFEQLLVRHPLMINLVRRLLWGGYDNKGKLVRTFRVAEERDYADSRDERVKLDGLAAVGIVHPLHLSEDERSAWGQVFGDYEIISPFPQLGRATHSLEAAEAPSRSIIRFAKIKIPGVSVASFLEKAGWQRGPLQDHGDFHEYYKHFPSAQMTAVVEVEPGLWVSNIADTEEQQLPRCFFRQGLVVPDWYDDRKDNKDMKLAKVDAVVMSEVLADLTNLASKGM